MGKVIRLDEVSFRNLISESVRMLLEAGVAGPKVGIYKKELELLNKVLSVGTLVVPVNSERTAIQSKKRLMKCMWTLHEYNAYFKGPIYWSDLGELEGMMSGYPAGFVDIVSELGQDFSEKYYNAFKEGGIMKNVGLGKNYWDYCTTIQDTNEWRALGVGEEEVGTPVQGVAITDETLKNILYKIEFVPDRQTQTSKRKASDELNVVIGKVVEMIGTIHLPGWLQNKVSVKGYDIVSERKYSKYIEILNNFIQELETVGVPPITENQLKYLIHLSNGKASPEKLGSLNKFQASELIEIYNDYYEGNGGLKDIAEEELAHYNFLF